MKEIIYSEAYSLPTPFSLIIPSLLSEILPAPKSSPLLFSSKGNRRFERCQIPEPGQSTCTTEGFQDQICDCHRWQVLINGFFWRSNHSDGTFYLSTLWKNPFHCWQVTPRLQLLLGLKESSMATALLPGWLIPYIVAAALHEHMRSDGIVTIWIVVENVYKATCRRIGPLGSSPKKKCILIRTNIMKNIGRSWVIFRLLTAMEKHYLLNFKMCIRHPSRTGKASGLS